MRDRTFVIMLTLVALAALSVSALGADMKTTSEQTCITPSQEDLNLICENCGQNMLSGRACS